MEYRAITKEEAKEAIRLSATSFYYNPKDSIKELERDKYHHEVIRGAFDGDKMVAMMKLWPFEAYFDGHIVKMGGIGSVATLPEHRRGGHVRKLFELLYEEMREEGYPLSYLYPFSHPYYRKFGYELCMSSPKITTKPEALLKYQREGRGELFINGEDGSDPEPIILIYNEFAKRHNLMLDRDGWWWERKLERDPYESKQRTYMWFDKHDRPAGYFSYKYEPHMYDADIEITDMAWVDKDGLYGLLSFIGKFSGNVTKLTFHCPPELRYEYLWPEPYELKVEIEPRGMARIMDVQKVMELIKKPINEGEVTLSVEDETAPWNQGCYHIAWGAGESFVKKIAQKTPDMACSIQALNQMATGYLGLTEAYFRDDVIVNSKQQILEELFCRKQTFISDHF